MRFTGKIIDSRFYPDDPAAFGDAMFHLCDMTVRVVLDPIGAHPTAKQQAYYYGVVVAAVVKKTGYTREQVNEILKKKFLRTDIGKLWERVRGVEELSEAEMSTYIDFCARLLQKRGYDIQTRSDQSLL
jgi:hypothetical protein